MTSFAQDSMKGSCQWPVASCQLLCRLQIDEKCGLRKINVGDGYDSDAARNPPACIIYNPKKEIT
jgi:hypothetical protein